MIVGVLFGFVFLFPGSCSAKCDDDGNSVVAAMRI